MRIKSNTKKFILVFGLFEEEFMAFGVVDKKQKRFVWK
jgi:hypothetical protein